MNKDFTSKLSSIKLERSSLSNKKIVLPALDRSSPPDLMHARRLIKQCQRAESKGKTLQNLERDLYVEELRQEKLRQSTDLLRELELAENP